MTNGICDMCNENYSHCICPMRPQSVDTVTELRAEVERLTRERDEARLATAAKALVAGARIVKSARAWARRWKDSAKAYKRAYQKLQRGYDDVCSKCAHTIPLEQVRKELGLDKEEP